ncbi:MAG: PilZ domain-containing protein [Desulfuromonadaceae bacterium]
MKKVLIPDIPELRHILEASFLAQQGFDFLVFDQLDQVLPLVEKNQPLLVILPLDLAGKKGDDCCLRLRKDPRFGTVSIVMLVRSGCSIDLMRSRAAGCEHYLYTPFDAALTMKTVCRFLRIIERASTRVETRFSLQFGSVPPVFYKGIALNMNCGGVFVATQKSFPVDTLLDLEFCWSQSEDVYRCRGRVAWVNPLDRAKNFRLPTGMGVAFVEPPADLVRVVQHFVTAGR